MKMLYPVEKGPKRLVIFKVHPQMTKFDVKQYLEKIYKVPVADVRLKMAYHDFAPLDAVEDTKRAAGASFPHLLPREPERYEKVAYVHLAPDHEFEFPDIFKDGKRPSEELNRLMEQTRAEGGLTAAKDAAEGAQEANPQAPPQPSQPSAGRLPRWFSS